MGRYTQNRIFSQNEMKKIEAAHVCVVGCGGLGGYVLELLARLGVGEITVVDGDSLEESNLNRQILSREANLGSSKVKAAEKRISSINSEIKLHALNKFLTPENAVEIISEMDLVIDALDSIETRKILAQACATENLVLVHAAIAG
ncbi:MAG: ThiF family adenylyltransferase [Candidatus Cloacimonadales bacterium]